MDNIDEEITSEERVRRNLNEETVITSVNDPSSDGRKKNSVSWVGVVSGRSNIDE